MMLNVTFNGASPNKNPILVDEDWWTLYRTPQYYVAAEYYDNGRQLVKNSVRPHMLHTQWPCHATIPSHTQRYRRLIRGAVLFSLCRCA